MNLAKFLYHEACPNCGSKDNLGVWDDGHKYCFGCKYHEQGTINLRQVFHPDLQQGKRAQDFPYDAQEGMPPKALKWLLSCGITFQLQKKHGILWSPSRQMVCWKIRGEQTKQQIAWQGRCFAEDAKSKYYIGGNVHDDYTIIPHSYTDETVVLVEDYLSAIRVSEHLPCMPLFSCVCSLAVLQQLLTRFNSIIVWLDSDKLDNARKIASDASMLGLPASVLYTPKDPKEYNDQQIKEFLWTLK